MTSVRAFEKCHVGNTSSTTISFFILTTIVGEEVVLAGFLVPLER